MTITKKTDGVQTILEIDGRVDANTSQKMQTEILKEFQTQKHLILDFAKVSYLSSAGLRALLIGQKTAASKNAVFEISKPGPVVISVLKSVGFDKIIKILP